MEPRKTASAPFRARVLWAVAALGLMACYHPPPPTSVLSGGPSSDATVFDDGVLRVAPSREPTAVVELFTSEGCASCPSADEFARKLHEEAEVRGVRVFVLAYHVDYWNELGHVDRFSAPRFTERQRWYADWWGTTRAYTPQMVIGGTEDISGNDRDTVLTAVSKQLDKKATVGISLTAASMGESFEITYSVDPPRSGDFLTVALVQDDAETPIRAGENTGRLLHHTNIVRDVALTHVASGEGSWTIEVPPDMPSGVVVAFVQHGRTRQVLGASKLRLM